MSIHRERFLGSCLRVAITLLVSVLVSVQWAQAQTFKVLHTFHLRGDGFGPNGPLVLDVDGNIYGTTASGGDSHKCHGYGCGTAFKMSKAGKESWLYTFTGRDGLLPAAGLLRDSKGNLFGTTAYGGDVDCGWPAGCGVVFRLDPTGKRETVLRRFTGPADAEFPAALLVTDKVGNLYGTTANGGALGLGVVFKLDPNGKETILHSFGQTGDGAIPPSGVTRDASGDLYGVTITGGASNAGTVYEIDTKGKETLLYSFKGSTDGAQPSSELLLDSHGNLYGTTKSGGTLECEGSGCGVVFKLSPQPGGRWSETVLYEFCSRAECADGAQPLVGPLAMDEAGSLYGTTYLGGTNGDGVVFKIGTDGEETVLHSFTGGTDGANPSAGLTMDRSGNLYGAASQGGSGCPACGVIFKITP